jgi:hypothetical protein
MTLAEMFAPHLRKVRKVEKPYSELWGKNKLIGGGGGGEGETQSSAPSAPALVPAEVAFTEGRRYRAAGVTEARNRLELYVEDPKGAWRRSHGVLIAVEPRKD